jgi:optic atrophy protein 1
MVDIKLKHWIEKELPMHSVRVGWDLLNDMFTKQLHTASTNRRGDKDDPLFAPIKGAVLDAAINKHQWDNKAVDYLRVIQSAALDDRDIADKRVWDEACAFMGQLGRKRLIDATQRLQQMQGPGWTDRWLRWRSATDEQNARAAVKMELDRILQAEPVSGAILGRTRTYVQKHNAALTNEDVTVIRRALETQGVTTSDALIQDTWHHYYRVQFLQRAVAVRTRVSACTCTHHLRRRPAIVVHSTSTTSAASARPT